MFSESRSASENYFEHARSLERQAAHLDEVGKRLEQIASYSETHGYQLSEDMSQYVASRYYEMTSGPYRGLGAPSLLDTNPTGAQRAARDLVVGRILDDYVRSDLERVDGHLVDPAEGSKPISAPPIWSPGQLSGGLSAHVRDVGHPVGTSRDTAIRQELMKGAEELDRAKARQEGSFSDGFRGAQDLQEDHTRRTDKAWFRDKQD